MEKLPGEAKDIAYHQNCNKYEYYFSGDRQLFEVLYNLNLHQYLNMTILIPLLPGGGVPRRGEVVGELIYLPTRARIYNNVLPSSSFHTSFQTYVLQHPYQSAIYEIVSKKFRKKDRYVWSE